MSIIAIHMTHHYTIIIVMATYLYPIHNIKFWSGIKVYGKVCSKYNRITVHILHKCAFNLSTFGYILHNGFFSNPLTIRLFPLCVSVCKYGTNNPYGLVVYIILYSSKCVIYAYTKKVAEFIFVCFLFMHKKADSISLELFNIVVPRPRFIRYG